ncbi:MAG: helix-turn-helix transcriptional regulator [Novosphingobium sp.]
MADAEHDALAALSEKQRAALDLLSKHMTSKQISRELGISPHTVDQRIESAKKKLGAATRGELALKYRALVRLCHQVTYEESHIAEDHGYHETGIGTEPELLLIQRGGGADDKHAPNWIDPELRVLPKLFEGRLGILARLGAIAAIAFLIVASVLGGIAIYEQLSALIAVHP